MLRIDENTAIDETLVTCAEYQKFIDAMCKQGHYYQPDHWEAYQPPAGKTQEPIRGIRQSDAVAFCRWFTITEADGWNYRLPTQEEANAFPIVPRTESPLGFWLAGDYQFTWVGTAYKNMNGVGLVGATTLIRSRPPKRDLELDLIAAGSLSLACNRDLDKRRERLRALDLVTDIALGITVDRDIFHSLRFSHTLELICAHSRKHLHPLDLEHTLSLALDLARGLVNNRNRTRSMFAAILKLNLVRAFSMARASDRKLKLAFDRGYNLDVFDDIYTLWERINHNQYLSGFEGIRLFRERIE